MFTFDINLFIEGSKKVKTSIEDFTSIVTLSQDLLNDVNELDDIDINNIVSDLTDVETKLEDLYSNI